MVELKGLAIPFFSVIYKTAKVHEENAIIRNFWGMGSRFKKSQVGVSQLALRSSSASPTTADTQAAKPTEGPRVITFK